MTGTRVGAGSISWSRRGLMARVLALTGLCAGQASAQDVPALIEMRKFAFAPAEVAVHAGATVIFVNLDLVPHTASATDDSFDTGTLRRNERKAVSFPTPGAFSYVCRFHPHMTGVVRVT